GLLAERGWDRGAWVQIAMLLGNVLIYVPGILWLKHELHVSFSKSLEFGLYPFIAGDLMKLFLAATVLPGAWAIVSNKQQPTSNKDDGKKGPPANGTLISNSTRV